MAQGRQKKCAECKTTETLTSSNGTEFWIKNKINGVRKFGNLCWFCYLNTGEYDRRMKASSK